MTAHETAATVTATLLLATPLGAHGQAACRTLADDAARLACYDAAFGGPDTPPAVAPSAARPPDAAPGVAPTPMAPTPAAAAPSAESLFGLTPVEAEVAVARAAGSAPLEAITTTVDDVGRTAAGKLKLTLANGQVWIQIDSSGLRVARGDAVNIRRAAFGSFLLSLAGGHQAMRVRRIS